jgi:hypothetical protein
MATDPTSQLTCEDLDLAYRALRIGPIGFAPAMQMTHFPRPLPLKGWIARASCALRGGSRASSPSRCSYIGTVVVMMLRPQPGRR